MVGELLRAVAVAVVAVACDLPSAPPAPPAPLVGGTYTGPLIIRGAEGSVMGWLRVTVVQSGSTLALTGASVSFMGRTVPLSDVSVSVDAAGLVSAPAGGYASWLSGGSIVADGTAAVARAGALLLAESARTRYRRAFRLSARLRR